MKIEVHYLRADGTDIVEVIERDCETKEQAGQVAIDYAKSKGSKHFPFFKVIEVAEDCPEPPDETDMVCPACGDPDCSRPFGHEVANAPDIYLGLPPRQSLQPMVQHSTLQRAAQNNRIWRKVDAGSEIDRDI